MGCRLNPCVLCACASLVLLGGLVALGVFDYRIMLGVIGFIYLSFIVAWTLGVSTSMSQFQSGGKQHPFKSAGVRRMRVPGSVAYRLYHPSNESNCFRKVGWFYEGAHAFVFGYLKLVFEDLDPDGCMAWFLTGIIRGMLFVVPLSWMHVPNLYRDVTPAQPFSCMGENEEKKKTNRVDNLQTLAENEKDTKCPEAIASTITTTTTTTATTTTTTVEAKTHAGLLPRRKRKEDEDDDAKKDGIDGEQSKHKTHHHHHPHHDEAIHRTGFPLLVFSHGLTGTNEEHSMLLSDIARHGYVVAALTHQDGSAARARMENGSTLYYQAQYDIDRPSQVKRRQAEFAAVREHVLEKSPEDLRAVIDRKTVIAGGFSYGATTAALESVTNPEEYQGVILFDGWFHVDGLDYPADVHRKGIQHPSLIMTSSRFDPTHPYARAGKRVAERAASLVSPCRAVELPDSAHEHFVDLPFWVPMKPPRCCCPRQPEGALANIMTVRDETLQFLALRARANDVV